MDGWTVHMGQSDMIKPDMTIERSMDRLSRQDSVVKLDRVMLYNMNGQSRQDSVVTTLLAMPTSIV